MSNARVWLFRVLILAATGLMLLSWFMPWWSTWIMRLNNLVQIRPWGLEHDLGVLAEYISGSEMPAFFAPAMWTYLGIGIAALLFSLWVKDRNVRLLRKNFNLPKFIIGLIGFSYIVVVVLAVIVAAIRTGDFFGLKLIGSTHIDMGEPLITDADSGLLSGYWLACGVGPLLIVLALLRNKIIGKTKLIT